MIIVNAQIPQVFVAPDLDIINYGAGHDARNNIVY